MGLTIGAGRPHFHADVPRRQTPGLVGGGADTSGEKFSAAAKLKLANEMSRNMSPAEKEKVIKAALDRDGNGFRITRTELNKVRQNPNASAICRHEKRIGRFGTGEYVDATPFHRNLRKFDCQRPIASKVAAVASVAALSTVIGSLCGAAVDMLAHMSDRKNDNAGRLFGTLVGCVVALTHGLMLFGAPRRFEMAMRAGEFRYDAKTPGGQSLRFIESASLPLARMVRRIGGENYGEPHNKGRVNSTDTCEAINDAVERGFKRDEFNAHFMVHNDAPPAHLPAHRLQCDIDSLGLLKGQYVLPKYFSFNHLFERDFNGRWDHSTRTLDDFLRVVKGGIRHEQKEAKRIRDEQNQDAPPKVAPPNTEIDASGEAASDCASEIDRDEVELNDDVELNDNVVGDPILEGQQVVSRKPDTQPSRANDPVAEDVAAAPKCYTTWSDDEKIAFVRQRFTDMFGDKKNATKIDKKTCLKLSDFYADPHKTTDSDNYSKLELLDHETYCELSQLFRGLVPQDEGLTKSWARIDEAGKVAALFTGLRPAGMHTFFRNLEDSVVRAFTGFADPNMQGQNAGMSAPMYLPMMVLGSTVTVLLLGMSASPAAPIPVAKELGGNSPDDQHRKIANSPLNEGLAGKSLSETSSSSSSVSPSNNAPYGAYLTSSGAGSFALAS